MQAACYLLLTGDDGDEELGGRYHRDARHHSRMIALERADDVGVE
jgi:hypothetical protein